MIDCHVFTPEIKAIVTEILNCHINFLVVTHIDIDHIDGICNMLYQMPKLKIDHIIYNNLFVEMYTENKEIANDFLKLNQYIKKICFVPFDNSSKELIQLKSYPGQKEFHEVVNSNARIGNNSLDYKIVDLLNGKVINRSK